MKADYEKEPVAFRGKLSSLPTDKVDLDDEENSKCQVLEVSIQMFPWHD